jgi:3-phenylpropionate/cinnamic acid dioxygenase small subunit
MPASSQRYRHLITPIRILGEAPAALEVEANILVVRTMQEGEMMLFAAGRYVDRVVRAGVDWKFAQKEVVLDSRSIDTLLAIPL